MDEALFHQNVEYFSQVVETPPTKPLIPSFGQYAKSLLAQQFRDGSLNIEDLNRDKYSTEFFKELQRKTNGPPEIDPTMTPTDIKNNYI
eukprot:15365737-Ditylum_brightwellii.AAC.1